ncbi:hypothetical protein KUTeg_022347 [Tegillarca granosa]|uniref:Uncharacterized protein n=1 Tax=Tegillarca granosa TaxID=220873 RepID=A0ABQ9E5Z1_TEGGR|nr:hypothetical protein KUTeg_022347 [Tegillarca granosa]
MAEEIPIIPKVNTLHIHSGNIVNWNRLKRKPNQTPTEELAECVSGTLTACLPTKDRNELQASTEWDCKHTKFMETLPADERGDLKVTDIMPVKRFKEIMASNLTEKDSERWEPQWAIRYSVLVKCRGIIKTKGYILKVDRDIKQRKV